jgi:hypothetical protein
MFERMKNEMLNRIENASWLDEESRNRTLAKVFNSIFVVKTI